MGGAWIIAVLALAALAASALSAVTGVAGGVLVLGALLLAVPATAVVPLHGTVQTVACLTRIGAFRRHIRWDMVGRLVAGILPGSALGALVVGLLVSLDASVIKLLIGSAILLSLAAKDLRFDPKTKSARILYPVGFAVGFFGILAGSTGPIVTQALLLFGIDKEEHVATKSVAQAVGHGIKLPLFGLAVGFDFGAWLWPLVAMCGAVAAGTLVGKRLLARISREAFTKIARVALALIVVHVFATELYRLLA